MGIPNRFLLFIIPLVVTAAPLFIGPWVIADFIGRPADGWGRDFLTLAVLILGAPYAAIAALIGVVLRRLSTTHVAGRGILWGVCAGVFLGISSCIGSTGLVTQ